MIITKERYAPYLKMIIVEGDTEVARASLFIIYNDLHEEPYGLLEDVHVLESFRGNGFGTQLVQVAIEKAQSLGCYKLIATSRYGRNLVHKLYENLGFVQHGIEFRMDLDHASA